jgi:hypothetical protein
MTDNPTADDIAPSMAALADLLRLAGETATGYRRFLIDAGWPEPIADAAASQVLGKLQGLVLK